jgi:hypothetical protein
MLHHRLGHLLNAIHMVYRPLRAVRQDRGQDGAGAPRIRIRSSFAYEADMLALLNDITYAGRGELIRLGADHRRVSRPEGNDAIYYQPALETRLAQAVGEHTSFAESFQKLARILNFSVTGSEYVGGIEL